MPDADSALTSIACHHFRGLHYPGSVGKALVTIRLTQQRATLLQVQSAFGFVQILGFTTPLRQRKLSGPNTNSLLDREKKWNAFFSDEEWIKARADSEKDGAINARVASSFLTPTKFSAIQ